MKKVFKIVGIAFLALIGLSIIFAIFDSGDEAKAPESKTESTLEETESYKQIFTFKGNGMKKSETFHLNGNDAKIIYNYKSESPQIGVFNVYVVEKGTDLMVEGGIPEIMTSSVNESSESTIQKSEGEYYLNVNGVGDWEVSVQEKQ